LYFLFLVSLSSATLCLPTAMLIDRCMIDCTIVLSWYLFDVCLFQSL
jgi:hypothetical protein